MTAEPVVRHTWTCPKCGSPLVVVGRYQRATGMLPLDCSTCLYGWEELPLDHESRKPKPKYNVFDWKCPDCLWSEPRVEGSHAYPCPACEMRKAWAKPETELGPVLSPKPKPGGVNYPPVFMYREEDNPNWWDRFFWALLGGVLGALIVSLTR